MSTEFIGFAAALLTTSCLLPQVLKSFKTKKTADISLPMYMALSLGCFLWAIYGLMISAPPVYLANGLSFILASTILSLKIKHG